MNLTNTVAGLDRCGHLPAGCASGSGAAAPQSLCTPALPAVGSESSMATGHSMSATMLTCSDRHCLVRCIAQHVRAVPLLSQRMPIRLTDRTKRLSSCSSAVQLLTTWLPSCYWGMCASTSFCPPPQCMYQTNSWDWQRNELNHVTWSSLHVQFGKARCIVLWCRPCRASRFYHQLRHGPCVVQTGNS